MKKVVTFVVVLGVGVAIALYRHDEDKQTVYNDIQEVIEQLEVYPANAEYLDELLAREHRLAFDAAYTPGSRRRAAELDEELYLTTLFDAMIKDADRSGKTDVRNQLQQVRDLLLAVEEDEEAA